MTLNNKQRKTLELIFTQPTPANISWKDIESLFRALDATIVEGQGSQVGVKLNDSRAVFHKPHPQKEAEKTTVKSVRIFLTKAGIEAETER